MNKLIIFSADWCGPCKRMRKHIEALPDHSRLIQYDFDIHADKSVKYNVDVIPTIIVIDKWGSEVTRRLGLQTTEMLLELLNV